MTRRALLSVPSLSTVFFTRCLHSTVFRLYFPYSFTSDCFLIYHSPRILIMNFWTLRMFWSYFPFLFHLPLAGLLIAYCLLLDYLSSRTFGLRLFQLMIFASLVSIFWWLHYDAKALCSYLSTFQYIIKVFKGPDSPDSPLPISTFIFSKFGNFVAGGRGGV